MIGEFIRNYGYLAVLLGTLLEGETVLLAAGFACHQGLLDWRLVAVLAVLGATLGDQSAFLVGRWKGTPLLRHFPSLERSLPRCIRRLIVAYSRRLINKLNSKYSLSYSFAGS
mgnify:CR=1 FL=1